MTKTREGEFDHDDLVATTSTTQSATQFGVDAGPTDLQQRRAQIMEETAALLQPSMQAFQSGDKLARTPLGARYVDTSSSVNPWLALMPM